VDILAKDTAESKVETAMEVTLNLLKDSRRPQGYKPDAWGINLIPGVTSGTNLMPGVQT